MTMNCETRKGFYPSLPHTLWLLIIGNLFIGLPASSLAQCPMTCNNGVQASLNEFCENEITWDVLLEGNPSPSCISGFVVEIFDLNGQVLPYSPFVTESEINQTLLGKVTHQPSGQSCQTNILVQDKLPPVVICVDTLLSCFHDTTPVIIGYPLYYDNCTFDVSIDYFDQNTVFNCTNTDTILIINRKWTVIDSSGNSSSCTQKIYVERPPLDSIDFPANLDNISAPPLFCTSAETDPIHTGMPMYENLMIDSICSFFVDYEDVTVPICNGSYTIFRDWTIYDGCEAASLAFEQTINVMDTLAPNLACPADFSVTVANNACQATVSLPQPVTYDSCSSAISLSLEGDFGLIAGMTIPDLAIGEYPTTCHATDDCGNVSSCQFNISVIDNIPPVAVSINNPLIALLPQGTTYLPASSFNGGSWDNCDNLTFLVKRVDSPDCEGNISIDYTDQVSFYCCDFGNQVEISLKVTDQSGNSSIINTFVQVSDNIEPTIICPPKLTLDCGEDLSDLSLTGEPSITENCSGFDVTLFDSTTLNICGIGVVNRYWEIIDIAGKKAQCVQEIKIENETPFYINKVDYNDPNDHVIWPKNYLSTSCGDGLLPGDLPTEFAFPQITNDSFCQMIAINYTDTWLSQPNNACIEILRSWTIVDWCQFNPSTFEGSWQFGQILRIQNSDAPVITSACDFEEFCSDDANCQIGEVQMQIEATDDCNAPSELKYVYNIDLFDDGSTDLTGGTSVVNVNLPLGIHRVYWTVEDGCNNEVLCDYLFAVIDCKKPTPVCSGMAIEITDSSDSTITVTAIELDAGSYDNCSPYDALLFTFSDNLTDTIKTFDCSNLGLNDIEMWVTDENGNQDFCKIDVEVQANSGACTNTAFITGVVSLNNGDNVSNVQISLNNLTALATDTTTQNGLYLFDNVLLEEDYTITPYKNSNPLNGVTTFDLALITRHILGTLFLDSPYKIIAADANNSGSVTTFDVVVIRKLILQINDSFPNNNSWRFVDKNFQFSNPLNPFLDDFPEVVNINNLVGDWIADFIAIKIGDVNDSVDVGE